VKLHLSQKKVQEIHKKMKLLHSLVPIKKPKGSHKAAPTATSKAAPNAAPKAVLKPLGASAENDMVVNNEEANEQLEQEQQQAKETKEKAAPKEPKAAKVGAEIPKIALA
jgi:hypothetical protein